MNRRLQTILTQIFFVWLTLFAVLVVMTVQSMEWPARYVPPQGLPVAVHAPAPEPEPVAEPAPEAAPVRLLPKGKKAGKGTIGKPALHWDRELGQVIVRVACTGTYGEYTSFAFNHNSALCLDFYGTWKTTPVDFVVRDKSSPIQRVQTGQHGSFVRLSLIGRRPAAHEVRVTDTGLEVVLTYGKGAQKAASSSK